MSREERVVHVNVSWVVLTGISSAECTGKLLSSLFDSTTDKKSLLLYHELTEKSKNRDNVTLFNRQKEGSDQASKSEGYIQAIDKTVRTASIIIAPIGKNNNYDSNTCKSKSYLLNPWDSKKAPLSQPKMSLSVSPVAIKDKHMAFLFISDSYIDVASSGIENSLIKNRHENIETSEAPKKRSKSMTSQHFLKDCFAVQLDSPLPLSQSFPLLPQPIVISPFNNSNDNSAVDVEVRVGPKIEINESIVVESNFSTGTCIDRHSSNSSSTYFKRLAILPKGKICRSASVQSMSPLSLSVCLSKNIIINSSLSLNKNLCI